jgi:putative ABC transport system permease protein
MAVVRRGVKNAFRNLIRSVSVVAILALAISLAVIMLLSRKAVEGRIEQVKGEVGTTITVTPAGSRGFAGGGEPLTAQQISTMGSTPHVQSVTQTLTDQVRTEGTTSFGRGGATQSSNATTNLTSSIDAGSLGRRFGGGGADGDGSTAGGGTGNGGSAGNGGSSSNSTFSLPIAVTGTTAPASAVVSGVGTLDITSGTAPDGTTADDVALVGTSLATKNNVAVGSTFTAYGQPITVVGIYDAGNTFANGGIIMPLQTVQNLSGQSGAVTTALVKVDSISNVGSATTALQSGLGSAADVVSDATRSADTISSLDSVKTIASFSLLGALVAGAVILFLSMLMIVRERRREIGVLKAIGASNRTISLQFIIEALTLTLGAAVVGLLIGIVLSNPVLDVMVTNNTNNTSQQAAPVQPGGRVGGAGGGAGGGATANGTGQGGAGGGGFAAPGGGRSGGANGGVPRFGAAAIGRGVTQFGGSLDNIRASVGVDVLLYGLLIAIAIAIAGSAVPSYLIARIRPAEVMRSE